LCNYEQIQSKINERKILLFPITVEEELGHMKGKKVLEELVGACVLKNKFKVN
jgi:hypothetical protein